MKTFKLKDGTLFNKETYDFEHGSRALAEFHPEHFNIWFDAKTFNFENASDELSEFCYDHFFKWQEFIK